MNELFDILKHDDLNAFKSFNCNDIVIDASFICVLDLFSKKINDDLCYTIIFSSHKGYLPTRTFLHGIKDNFLGMAYLFNSEKIFFYLFEHLDNELQSKVIDYFINNDLDYFPRYRLLYQFFTMLKNDFFTEKMVLRSTLMSCLWFDMNMDGLNDICIAKRPSILNDFIDRLNIGFYLDDIYLYNDCYIFDYLMILIQLSNGWNIKMETSFITDYFKKYLDTDMFLSKIDKHSFYTKEKVISQQAAEALYLFMKRHGLMQNCENLMSYVIKNIQPACILPDDLWLLNKINVCYSLQIPLLDITRAFKSDVDLINIELDLL